MVKRASLTKTILILLVLVLLTAFMVFLIFKVVNYVEESIYHERVVHLTAQTDAVAMIIDSTMEQNLNYTRNCSNVVSRSLREGADIYAFMDEFTANISDGALSVILVDSDGVWYGSGNRTGRVSATEHYSPDAPSEVIYLTSVMPTGKEAIIYRVRLPETLCVDTGNGSADISYCVTINYLDDMNEVISKAFPFESNRFILNEDGLMIYRDMQLGFLMEGTNVLQKYGLVDFLHGGTSEEQLNALASGQSAVGEFPLQGINYFICTSPLKYNGWYISFVFPEEVLSSGTYIRTVTGYLIAISVAFSLLFCIAVFFLALARENRRSLEEEQTKNGLLQSISDAKSAFLSNMSHDIRTPINGIIGMTRIAQDSEDPEKVATCLHKIQVSSNYLLSLVNDVLDMASIESGKIAIRNEPMDLRTFTDACASVTASLLHGRKVGFTADYTELPHPYVIGDEAHLRQVIINILSNAVKFTPDGGRILLTVKELSCCETDQRVNIRFQITDTGVGMEPEFLEKIFDRFSQESAGSRSKFKGTGLGMAISKQLTEMMGGSIHVESVPGKGSCFTVDLPFAKNPVPDEPEVQEDFGIPDCSGSTVLIAEDNDINMEITSDFVSRTGASVLQAVNGEEAVRIFSESKEGEISLILMDIMMPELDGLAATRAIRALSRSDASSVAIVAMSANAFKEDIDASIEAGMNRHLSKPVDERALYYTLSQYCSKE